MTRKTRTILIVAILVSVCGLSTAAQELSGRDDTRPPLGSRVRENIITLKLLRMTQALDLTQEQTAVIYPVLTRLEKEKYEATFKLNSRMKELGLLLEQDKPAEDKILGLMSDISSLRDLIMARDAEATVFLKGKLSVMQSAKYLLFNVEFYRGLGERLERARMGRNKNRFTR